MTVINGGRSLSLASGISWRTTVVINHILSSHQQQIYKSDDNVIFHQRSAAVYQATWNFTIKRQVLQMDHFFTSSTTIHTQHPRCTLQQ